MKTIDLKKVLLTLDGKEIENNNKKPFTIGEALANICLASQNEGKMKMYVLAQKFFSQNKIDLDAGDFSMIKRIVETEKGIYASALIQGQILVILEEIK